MEKKKAASGRVLYYDLLRIVATLAVMILHVSGQNWRKVDVTSFTWQTFNFYDGIVRWSVPIFVMLSGALFLEREVSLEKLYKKNILRIVTAFAFWSCLYALVNRLQGLRWRKTILQMIEGPFHLWFLFLIVGLYMIVPFIKNIADSPMLTRYFLILSFCFTFLIPQGLKGITFFSKDLGGSLKNAVTDINFHFTLGYVSYFLLGYYLKKTDIPKKIRYVIYILCIAGFAVTIGATSALSVYLDNPTTTYYGNLTINVMLESVGLFVFFKYAFASCKVSPKMEKWIVTLSNYSFGAYLVHALFIDQLDKLFGINSLSFSPILSVPVIVLVVCVLSFLVSAILHRIPLLNKYIV